MKVFTVGVYDLLHIGHVELFRRARLIGDYLLVGVQNSEKVLEYKPNTNLIYSTEERMYMVKSIKYVNEVVPYDDVFSVIKDVDFDIFIIGPDQLHDGFKKSVKWCKENGKIVKVLSRTDSISSSILKERIKNLKWLII